MSANLDRLQAVGIAMKTPLEEPQASIVNDLSEQEVDALISLKGRFDEKTAVQAHGMETEGPADEFFAVL